MKPPTLTIPVAVPSRWAGLKVRAKSKPIMEPGPPTARVTTSAARSQSGARPGTSRTAAQAVAVASGNEQHHGGAPQRMPGNESAHQGSGGDGAGDVQRHEGRDRACGPVPAAEIRKG